MFQFVESINQCKDFVTYFNVVFLVGLIDKWLVQSCANKNADILSAALLCARQCCVENSAKFGSYSSWFGNLQLRPASAYTYFFNFLSELVPYEPVLYLKIHVNKVSSYTFNFCTWFSRSVSLGFPTGHWCASSPYLEMVYRKARPQLYDGGVQSQRWWTWLKIYNVVSIK